jgi:hypothetical protein
MLDARCVDAQALTDTVSSQALLDMQPSDLSDQCLSQARLSDPCALCLASLPIAISRVFGLSTKEEMTGVVSGGVVKKIILKTLPDARLGDIDYKVVLTEVVRRPLDPQRGVSIQEMRESLKVLDALESANGTLELEDSDYEHLLQKLTAMPWNVVDRRLVQLVDDVTSA